MPEKVTIHAFHKDVTDGPFPVPFSQCGKRMVGKDSTFLMAVDFLVLHKQETRDVMRPLCSECVAILWGIRQPTVSAILQSAP
jgi:hypothetical protein